MLGDWEKPLRFLQVVAYFRRQIQSRDPFYEAEEGHPRLHSLFPSQFWFWNLLHVPLRRVFALDTTRRMFTDGCKFLTASRYMHERNLWRWPHEVQTWSNLHKICVYLIVQSTVLWWSWTRQQSWFVREDAGCLQDHAAVSRDTVEKKPCSFPLCWCMDCQIERKGSGVYFKNTLLVFESKMLRKIFGPNKRKITDNIIIIIIIIIIGSIIPLGT